MKKPLYWIFYLIQGRNLLQGKELYNLVSPVPTWLPRDANDKKDAGLAPNYPLADDTALNISARLIIPDHSGWYRWLNVNKSIDSAKFPTFSIILRPKYEYCIFPLWMFPEEGCKQSCKSIYLTHNTGSPSPELAFRLVSRSLPQRMYN